jgi:hypothetical protein
MIYNTLCTQLNIDKYESTKNRRWTLVLRRVSHFCYSSGICRDILVTNPVISHEEERVGKSWRKVEHIRGHLWHRYSVPVLHTHFSSILIFLPWKMSIYSVFLPEKLVYTKISPGKMSIYWIFPRKSKYVLTHTHFSPHTSFSPFLF